MTRVLSGAVLLIIAVAVVWFAPATLFVIIAEGLLVLACREFVDLAFSHAGLDYRRYVVSDPDLFRPAEVNLLLGDCSKARARLGWKNQIRFENLVREMVEEDCRAMGVGEFQRATQGSD